MSFIPEEDLKGQTAINLAPMIDFLFLMLAVFACLSVTRISLKDTEISLVKAESQSSSLQKPAPRLEYKIINIAVTEEGTYKWVTDVKNHSMNSAREIADELIRQYERGLLPIEKKQTQILLKIDKNASWDPILTLILAVRDAGFDVRSVYEPINSDTN